jgi:hypothetical protein
MIVCVIGPSAAGKSTLAKWLEERHPQLFARVPADYFFVPRRDQPLEDYLAVPLAYDWDAVDRALARSGPERSTPDCDFERFVRRSDDGGLPINDAPVHVLDGMRAHPRCDLVVLLELDRTEQRRRLVERDTRWGSRVADREPHLDATFAAGCAELPRKPDLRLSATAPIEANASRVIDAIYADGRRPGARAVPQGCCRSSGIEPIDGGAGV